MKQDGGMRVVPKPYKTKCRNKLIKNTTKMIDTKMTVKDRIGDYAALVTDFNGKRWSDMKLTYAPAPIASVLVGKRYAKIVVSDDGHKRVHSFIDLTNGDILKAATWKAPAPRGVRGNVWAEDLGASVVNWHGTIYLK